MDDSTSIYENSYARHVSAGHAVAFGFARHALIAALAARGLEPGDEVILSPLTCKVVPLALLSMKLKPVYADISPATLNLDPAKTLEKISSATRAILFQHTYGHSGGVESVAELANRHKLFLLEDCAQCMPVFIDDYRPGQYGAAAIFSNNSGKPLPAGSGGMATTDDIHLAKRMQAIRDRMPVRGRFGEFRGSTELWLHRYLLRPSLYWPLYDLHRRLDSNYTSQSLDVEINNEITTTALRPSHRQVQRGQRALHEVTRVVQHRTACCVDYRNILAAIGRSCTPFETDSTPLYYYPIMVNEKKKLLQRARAARVEIIPWPISTPVYPVREMADLATYGYQAGECRQAETTAAQLVGLPTHEKITPAIRRRIIALVESEVGKS